MSISYPPACIARSSVLSLCTRASFPAFSSLWQSASMAQTATHTSNSAIRLVVMPGDGIGPEITEATLAVLSAAERAYGVKLAFQQVPIGHLALKTQGTTLPDSSFEPAKAADGVILGPVSHNEYPPAAQG